MPLGGLFSAGCRRVVARSLSPVLGRPGALALLESRRERLEVTLPTSAARFDGVPVVVATRAWWLLRCIGRVPSPALRSGCGCPEKPRPGVTLTVTQPDFQHSAGSAAVPSPSDGFSEAAFLSQRYMHTAASGTQSRLLARPLPRKLMAFAAVAVPEFSTLGRGLVPGCGRA